MSQKEKIFTVVNFVFLIILIVITFVLTKSLNLLIFLLIIITISFITTKFFLLQYNKPAKIIKEKEGNSLEKLEVEDSLPFPFAIVTDNNIEYLSKEFKNRFKIFSSKNILDLMPNYVEDVKRQKVEINNSIFLLYVSKVYYYPKHISEIIYFVELFPETLHTTANLIEPVVVSQIIIDNYQEVFDVVEEIKKPLLGAVIDRQLSSLAQQVGGIVKKYEKDKYIFLFSKDKLAFLKEEKFDILRQTREIDMGNKMPVTLSIGMGISEINLSQGMAFAQQALDLALGRGGDQVLIKDETQYYFYGGVVKEVGSKTRVRARVKAYALGELINETDDVIIMGHRNVDLDCIGSAVGINAIVRAYGKNSKIVLDKVTTSINILYDRILEEAPEYKENVFITSNEALKIINDKTLLIIVDTNRPSILECKELLDKTKRIVVFDHHRKSADYIQNPVLNYHEPYASSTSELVTEMLLYVKYPVNLKQIEADALLAGITVDTKNFAFKTGAKTFEAAAYLRRKGADGVRVRLLFRNKMESYKAKAVAVNNAQILGDDMAISICPSNIENPSLVTAQAADDLLNIRGIKASFVLCEEDDKIVISARSIDSINVQVIMEKLGGGGHQTVAGAQITDMTLEDALDALKEVIEKYNMEG